MLFLYETAPGMDASDEVGRRPKARIRLSTALAGVGPSRCPLPIPLGTKAIHSWMSGNCLAVYVSLLVVDPVFLSSVAGGLRKPQAYHERPFCPTKKAGAPKIENATYCAFWQQLSDCVSDTGS